MSKVAFLGLGAMGSRMAANLLRAGHELTVWNREPQAAVKLVAAGAEFVNSEAVVDGTMVSARAWPDHPAWMREFVKILRQKAPVLDQTDLKQAAAR